MENKAVIPKKRKRDSLGFEKLTEEEKRSKIDELNREIDGLIKYFKEVSGKNSILVELSGSCLSLDQEIACLIEESELPYSKLVEKVYEKVKGKETLVSVQNKVLQIGQRLIYGVAPNADAIALEDSSENCLWCWETRDLKLLPKAQRGFITIRRTCRKKIQDRISAVSAMIASLQALDSLPNFKVDMMKASEKIAKVLNEKDIRLLVENLVQKSGTEFAEKEAKLKEKALVKELERNKRELEKEKKRMDREQLKEKLQNEKEQKRLQEEAEKEERLHEAEKRKQIKRLQEEAEREQRRREKEEALLKHQLSLKKQANLMERFLKRKTNNSGNEDDPSSPKAVTSDSPAKGDTENLNAVTFSMDSAFSLNDNLNISELYRSHRDIWNNLGHNIRSGNSRHWGLRQKPKVTIVKELKLQGSSPETRVLDKFTTPDKSARGNTDVEKVKDDWMESTPDARLCHADDGSPTDIRICTRNKKLLQFDKSHRPAYYGTLSVKSDVIGPRHPLRKDSNLDYDVQSDEEWEEEDPGESLSDCEKDEEEEILVEETIKGDDEDESEDGFLVPDGYLSENEGVQVDSMETDSDDDIRNSPTPKQDPDGEEFRALFQLQKRIHNITELALQKNQPLIISNLMHEKVALLSAEDLSGTSKLEQMFLQALSLRPFPGGSPIEISDHNTPDEDQDVQESQNNGTPVLQERTDVLDKELSKIASCIKSCPHGIGKIIELLQKSFPAVSKAQLGNKVREISVFVENRWQVKKEILDKLGLTASPEKNIERPRGIAAFFSKRCLPPAGGPMKMDETSPQQKQKTEMHGNDERCIVDIL